MAVQKNFTIKNGLEVNNNLIFADTGSNKVGIATTSVNYTLDVNGGIGAKSLIVSGVSTFNNIRIDGSVSLGSSLGSPGQYLVSTGTGVTWTAVPTVRSSETQTAGIGVTTFSITYSVGLLDVYINGVKLSGDEYIANDGATVVLDDACFGGETVEFITYSPFGIGVGGSSLQGITILEEGTPIGSPLQINSINFVGASVTAVGSGFGVTVYLSDYVNSSGISSYSDISGISSYSDVSGIATVSEGLTGNPNIEVGIITASNVVIGGGTTQLIVTGDARVTGILTVGSSSITIDGSTNVINVGSGITISGDTGSIEATSLTISGETLFGAGVISITAGSGISVDQPSGNIVISATGDGISSQWETTDVGINTLSNVGIGTTNSTSALTVTGDAIVSGVITATSFIGDGSGLTGIVGSGSGIVITDDGSTVGTAGTIDFGEGLLVSTISAGVVTVTSSSGSFSQWETTTAGIHTLSNVGIGTTNPTDTLTVRGGDISVGIDTSQGLILTSPNGTRYRLIVSDDGTLGTSAV